MRLVKKEGIMRFLTACLLVGFCSSCNDDGQITEGVDYQAPYINEGGGTIRERFNPPAGYQRKQADGFGNYLRSLKLKKHGTPVRYYNGRTKAAGSVYCAVVEMEIGDKDLQQCADAVMRLRGEYLYHAKQFNQLHFNFTNGFNAQYTRWVEGDRISIKGNNVSWIRSGTADSSYSCFRKYMDVVFTYAGTLSLSKELTPVDYKDMRIGDVLIRGGSPGHAVIVVDMAENRLGKKVYLLAQSYMPAQETQVLINPASSELSPWYELDEVAQAVETPEWQFGPSELKRFAE